MKIGQLSLTIILMALFLIPVSLAFPVESYLFSNEKAADVKAENFFMGGANYTLLSIGTKQIMLLQDNRILQDQAKIKDTLRAYFKEKYYPNESAVQLIKNLVAEYNYSRNDGTRFKGKEEYSCRDVLLLNGVVLGGPFGSNKTYCTDEASCTRIGQLFYSAPYTEGIRQSVSIETAIQYIKSFAGASDGNERLMRADLEAANNMTDERLINTSLGVIKNSISQLKTNKNTIENHIVRTPRLNDSADRSRCLTERCYGLCPDFDFNDTALSLLETKTNEMISKVGPIADYERISSDVYNSTKKRIEFLDKESKSDYYQEIYDKESESGYPVMISGENALRIVVNASLQIKVERLKQLHNGINASIIKRNFTSIENDLDEYETLVSEVNKMTAPSLRVYNETVNAKKQADIVLFLLETKSLDQQPGKRFAVLKESVSTIDSTFKQGLSQEDYVSLAAVYSNATKEAKLISRMQNESPLNALSLKLRAMARNINEGAGNLLARLGVAPQTVTANRTLFFGGTSLFVFLSMASVIALGLLMVYTFAKSSGNTMKIAIVLALLVMLGTMLGFSAIFYIFLDKTANSAELEEFVLDMNRKNSTTVFVDFTEAPGDAQADMAECGNAIMEKIKGGNKSVSLYNYYGNKCTFYPGAIQKATGACIQDIQNSSAIVLKYSGTKKKPEFTAVYEIRAYLYGDKNYYRSCTISDIVD